MSQMKNCRECGNTCVGDENLCNICLQEFEDEYEDWYDGWHEECCQDFTQNRKEEETEAKRNNPRYFGNAINPIQWNWW